MRTRVLALGLGAASLATAGAIGFLPGAATAAPHSSGGEVAVCPAPLHTYQHINYRGGWKKFCKSDMNLHDNKFNNGVKADNQISSVKNPHGCYWTLWQYSWNRGAHTTSYPHTNDPDLRNDAIRDNRTSSLYKSCPQ